jgi:alkylation response protein AidB-like acyl-CoA dehydrogenase
VTIKPIKQIDGGSEFNEVFMTDVRVPVTNRLGEEGQGWEIVSGALVNERSGIAGSIRSDQTLDWIIRTAQQQGKTQDPNVRQKIADLAIKGSIMRCAGLRSMTDSLHKRLNPHLSAAMKLMGTTLVQEFSETGVELLGPYGVLMNDSHAPFEGKWAKQMLGDRSMTIAGGTSEVQRNIVAQRVLGLPRR